MDIATLTRGIEASRSQLPRLKAAAEEAEAKAKAQVKMPDGGLPEGMSEDEYRGLQVIANADLFSAVDDAWKPYSEKREELDTAQANLIALMTKSAPGGQLPDTRGFMWGGAPEGAGDGSGVKMMPHIDVRQKAGMAFRESEAFMHAQEWVRNPGNPLGNTKSTEVLSRAEVKTLVTGLSSTSAGAFVVEDRGAFVDFLREDPASILSLFSMRETDSDTVEFVRQDSFTNNAAAASEGNALAESAITFEVVQAEVENIGHFIPLTLRALADAAGLQGIVEDELLTGVLTALANQVLSGNGTTPNLDGLYSVSGTQSQALGADTRLDSLHKAITKVRLVFGEPDGIGIHPNDYQDIRLQKDAMGRYMMGDPGAVGTPSAFGVPFKPSTLWTSGAPVTGAFKRAGRIAMRQGVQLAMSDSHDDYFVKQKVALRASLRAAMEYPRPSMLVIHSGF